MLADPKVLIAAHPTRGIDVGAQAAVWQSLREARAKGLGVLLVSADLDELIGLSDTLLVILRGAIVATLDPATVTPVRTRIIHDRCNTGFSPRTNGISTYETCSAASIPHCTGAGRSGFSTRCRNCRPHCWP